MPGIIIRKFLRNLNDYGFSITLGKFIFYLIRPVYEKRTYRIYRFDIERLRDIPSKESVFAFKVIGKSDTGIIRQIEAMEEWLEGKVASMLEDGGFCVVALDGERVAGFNLLSLGVGDIPLIGLRRTLRENKVWSNQITVDKNYRRKGVGTALRYRVFAELKKREISKIYGGTQLYNLASLNLARKIGFKEIVDVQYLKVFNIKRLRYKRVRN
jgi:GNAT superfamily N-acetyltransferase